MLPEAGLGPPAADPPNSAMVDLARGALITLQILLDDMPGSRMNTGYWQGMAGEPQWYCLPGHARCLLVTLERVTLMFNQTNTLRC